MKNPVKINYLIAASLAALTVAACDSNHDGDKGAPWGTDKQDESGSEITDGNLKDQDREKDKFSKPDSAGVTNSPDHQSNTNGGGIGTGNQTDQMQGASGNQNQGTQGSTGSSGSTAPTGSRNYGTQGATGNKGKTKD